MLFSNLGLTAFVRHLVDLLSRFQSLPSGEKNVKGIKTSTVFSFFVPYHSKKQYLQMLPLFSKKVYISHRIYRETKVYIIKSPQPCLHRGPPSGHESPLGYFRTPH
jgi:hypothetical protein